MANQDATLSGVSEDAENVNLNNEDDAALQDASVTDKNASTQRGFRNAAMDAIERRRIETLNKELEESGLNPIELPPLGGGGEDESGKEKGAAAEKTDPPAGNAGKESEPGKGGDKGKPGAAPYEMASVTMPDGSVVQVPASAIRTNVVVDGQQSTVDLTQMARNYQTASAANQRMEQASQSQELSKQLLAQINDRVGELERRTAKNSGQPPKTGADGEAVGGEELRALVRDALDKLVDGDTDQAVDELVKVLGARAQTLDPAQLANQVATIVEKRAAGKEFQSTFKDIMADPALFGRADAIATDLLAKNPQMSEREAFHQAGTQVREEAEGNKIVEYLRANPNLNYEQASAAIKGEKQPGSEGNGGAKEKPAGSANNGNSGMDGRKQAKRRVADPLPRADSSLPLGEDQPTSENTSSVIADMARARGQNHLTRG